MPRRYAYRRGRVRRRIGYRRRRRKRAISYRPRRSLYRRKKGPVGSNIARRGRNGMAGIPPYMRSRFLPQKFRMKMVNRGQGTLVFPAVAGQMSQYIGISMNSVFDPEALAPTGGENKSAVGYVRMTNLYGKNLVISSRVSFFVIRQNLLDAEWLQAYSWLGKASEWVAPISGTKRDTDREAQQDSKWKMHAPFGQVAEFKNNHGRAFSRVFNLKHNHYGVNRGNPFGSNYAAIAGADPDDEVICYVSVGKMDINSAVAGTVQISYKIEYDVVFFDPYDSIV